MLSVPCPFMIHHRYTTATEKNGWLGPALQQHQCGFMAGHRSTDGHAQLPRPIAHAHWGAVLLVWNNSRTAAVRIGESLDSLDLRNGAWLCT